jgi:hypothetical protein
MLQVQEQGVHQQRNEARRSQQEILVDTALNINSTLMVSEEHSLALTPEPELEPELDALRHREEENGLCISLTVTTSNFSKKV